jgi:hypothetical protein
MPARFERVRRLVIATLVAAVATSTCHLVTPFDGVRVDDAGVDAGADGDASDGGVDAATDGDLDGDGPGEPGPLVMVIDALAITAEQVCDVDGDGILDNSLARLGAGEGAVFATALSAAINEARSNSQRLALHFRWIGDLSGPDADDARMVAYLGRDTDLPTEPSDDFSGEEPFYVDANDLDPCGEPFAGIDGIRIEGGEVQGEGGVFGVGFGSTRFELVTTELSGRMAPGGASFEGRVCGYVSVEGFEKLEELEFVPGLTLLELLLGGGAPIGLPVAGLTLDIDVDGDGLESFVLDDSSHIESCIDGDRTLIEGRDCWKDPRIVDGFSLTFDFGAVPARFEAREPGWEYQVPVSCDGFPLTDSFFSTIPRPDTPCVGLDERCDPRAPEPCCDPDHRCSGANQRSYRCYPPCEPSPCAFGDLLAGCRDDYIEDGPLCWPVDDGLADEGCAPGESGCTTSYGASGDTLCLEHGADIVCAERCSDPPEPCGSDRHCVPLAFEEGGVCAFLPGYGES